MHEWHQTIMFTTLYYRDKDLLCLATSCVLLSFISSDSLGVALFIVTSLTKRSQTAII